MPALRPVPDRPPRAVLYLRQSVHRDDSISLELQETAGRDYCTRMGYTVAAVESDPGLSGRKWDNRPAVQRVLTMIEEKNADVIILWKWSRLSRNRTHWALAVDRVEAAGGRIESATEPIDTATASGRFARGVMTEYAAFQSEQIGEQWEEVRQRRLKRGLQPSGRLPWGWEWVKGVGIRAVPERVEIVQRMYTMYLAGHGSASIARWLNAQRIPSPNGGIWSRSRPFTVMDSPVHAGRINYRGTEYDGAHEGIISDATWNEYKRLREERRVTPTKPRTSKYLLSGLVRCHCGLRMAGKGAITSGKWYSGYICTSQALDHGASYVSSMQIGAATREWLSTVIAEVSELVDPSVEVDRAASVERLRAEWGAQQRRLDKLTALLIDDVIPEASYAATRREVENRQREIRQELDAAEQHVPPETKQIAYDLERDWETLPIDSRQGMLRALLREVQVTPHESAIFTTRWGSSSTVALE